MNISQSLSRSFFLAASCAAFVTVGCGGAGGGAAPAPTSGTGGNAGASSAPSAPIAGNGGAGVGDAGNGPAPTPTPSAPGAGAGPHAQHKRCGWIGADTFAAGKASFLANPDYYDAIHPKWGTVMGDGSIRVLSMANDADIMSTAKQHGVKVIPLVDADQVDWLRNVMASPQAIAQHVATVTAFVVNNGYDGVELDYEHLWNGSDRAPYTALITAVAASLHAQGKVLTLALPAMDHDSPSAYDYTQLQNVVDVMHLMAYDYHYMGGDHLGPLAPKGWVNDVVTRVQSLGQPQKYTLGVANYGIANGWYTSAKDAASRCNGGTYSSQTDHMAGCSYGHPEAGLAPNCQTAQGQVWFEDTASMTEKATLAQQHGLGGVGYWTMGDEPDGFLPSMQKLYPAPAGN